MSPPVKSQGEDKSKNKESKNLSRSATSAKVLKRGYSTSSSGTSTNSKGSRKDRTARSSIDGSTSEEKHPTAVAPSNIEYFCGPCIDEIICKRQSLMLSEKDVEDLQSGPMIYK